MSPNLRHYVDLLSKLSMCWLDTQYRENFAHRATFGYDITSIGSENHGNIQ